MHTLEIPWDDDVEDLTELDARLERLSRDAGYPCLLCSLPAALDEDDD